jgi:hypothetical protein
MAESDTPVAVAAHADPTETSPQFHARRWFDLAVCLAFTVVAYQLRIETLPTDGLWFDDSWVAAGAIHGQLSTLMTTGSAHPGFTLVLMVIDRLGGDLRSLAYPALIAGVVGPAAFYIALRMLGYARSICALMGAALVVADIHIIYSGRVKSYTFDPLLVLALAVVLPRLARITWTWRLAAAWVVATVAIGTFSGYVLIATAAAAFILFLNPASDRFIRLGALGAQGLLQLGYYLWVQRSANLSDIETVMETAYDGHMDFYLNPVEFGRETLTHLQRIITVFPGGSGSWLTVFALVALAGLLIAVVKGRDATERLPAQYFALIVGFAFVGGLTDRFPFGPTAEYFLSSGGRHTLWMIPAFAFGLAVVLQRLRLLVPTKARFPLRAAFDVVVVGVAVLVVVNGYDAPLEYPNPGSASAVEFVDAELGSDDVAIITATSVYSYSLGTPLPVTLEPTPERTIGFTPVVADTRIAMVGSFGQLPDRPRAIRRAVGDADRVLVIAGGPLGVGKLDLVSGALEPMGFELEETRSFGTFETVQIWSR